MPDSLENLKARSDAYLSGYHDAVRYVTGKVQEMHEKEYYALVRLWKDNSTMYDRILQSSKVRQLDAILKMLEAMK